VAERTAALLRRASRFAAAGWVAARETATFLDKRRRDRRFAVNPWPRARWANVAALVLSLILLLAVFADPSLVAWQASLDPGLRAFFEAVTDAGQTHWVMLAAAVLILISAWREQAGAGPAQRALPLRRSFDLAYLVVSVAAAGLIAVALKYGIGRARPRHFEVEGVLAFQPLLGGASWASFPSGHATNVAAVSMAAALLFPRYRPAILILALWLAFSRLATRSHYPSDVAAGLALGAAVAWLTARAFARARLVFIFDASGRLRRRGPARPST